LISNIQKIAARLKDAPMLLRSHLQPSLVIQRFAERTGFPEWLYSGTSYVPGAALPAYIEVSDAITMIGNGGRHGDLAVTLPFAIASFRVSTLSALIIGFEHAPTLGDALDLLSQYGGARNGHFRFVVKRHPNTTELWLQPRAPLGDAALLLNEPTVFNYIELIRTMRLGDAGGMVATLEHGRHSLSVQLWPDVGAVRYGEGKTSLRFPRCWEDEPNPRFDPDIWKVASNRCAATAHAVSAGELLFRLKGDMEQQLRETGKVPTLAMLSKSRGVSARTLVRQLKSIGSSYQHLVDDIQKARAMELLRLQGARIWNIAEQLGFSDSSSFSRSFRRWYGANPSQFVAIK
jgi:AraC-like DNA-binding protein